MKAWWQRKKLVEVATLQRGFDLPVQDRVSGDVPLVTSSGITDTHNEIRVRGPGVATGRSGSIGNVFFIEGDYWPLNTVLYVKDFHGNNPRFVFHLLKNFDLKRFASGVGVPTLNRNFVHDEIVCVPSLPEQQRIVAILDEAFDGIATAKANAEKNLQNARALFESHLQSVFTERGEGWVEKRLDDLYRIGSSKRVLKSQWTSEGVPFYRGREVTKLAADGFVDNELFISEEHYAQLAKQTGVPAAGDIVITAIGTIGNAHVVRAEDRFYFKDASVLWMKRISDICTDFTRFWLKSPLFFDQLDRGNGATVDTLTIQRLQSMKICIPSVAAQQEIVTALSTLRDETQRLESLYQQKLTALDDLKKSLLHQAFSGAL